MVLVSGCNNTVNGWSSKSSEKKQGKSVESGENRGRQSWRKAQQSVADKIKPAGPAKQNAAKGTS